MSVERADVVTVRIPNALLPRTDRRGCVQVQGGTVREIIESLEHRHPGLRFSLCHETGDLRPFVNVFVEGENVRYLEGMETAVHPGATVHIFHSVAGGQGSE